MPIALIRHGAYAQPEQVPSAWLPYGLTEEGKAQSREAAGIIAELAKDNGWEIASVIDSSRMRRAWETASILAAELSRSLGQSFEVEEFDALAERGVGALANLSTQSIAEAVEADPRFAPLPKGWKRDSHFRLPVQGAESLMDAGRRVMQHVKRRAQSLGSDQLKLCVGHGGAIRHAAHLLGALDLEQISALSMHYARPIILQLHAGYADHVAGDWKVRTQKERQLD